MIVLMGNRLTANLIAAMSARRDIPINLACFINGKRYLIIIPAGANLNGFLDADGSISIDKLAAVFGAVEM